MEVVRKAVELKAFVPSAVVVAVPPFAAGMTPVSENVVEPFVIEVVTLPEPKRLKKAD